MLWLPIVLSIINVLSLGYILAKTEDKVDCVCRLIGTCLGIWVIWLLYFYHG